MLLTRIFWLVDGCMVADESLHTLGRVVCDDGCHAERACMIKREGVEAEEWSNRVLYWVKKSRGVIQTQVEWRDPFRFLEEHLDKQAVPSAVVAVMQPSLACLAWRPMWRGLCGGGGGRCTCSVPMTDWRLVSPVCPVHCSYPVSLHHDDNDRQHSGTLPTLGPCPHLSRFIRLRAIHDIRCDPSLPSH